MDAAIEQENRLIIVMKSLMSKCSILMMNKLITIWTKMIILQLKYQDLDANQLSNK